MRLLPQHQFKSVVAMSDVDTSDTDEACDNDDIILIKSFAVKKGNGKKHQRQAGTAQHLCLARSYGRGPHATLAFPANSKVSPCCFTGGASAAGAPERSHLVQSDELDTRMESLSKRIDVGC